MCNSNFCKIILGVTWAHFLYYYMCHETSQSIEVEYLLKKFIDVEPFNYNTIVINIVWFFFFFFFE